MHEAGLFLPWSDFNMDLLVSTVITVEAEFASIFIAALAIVASFLPRKELDVVRSKMWFPDIWRFLSITACIFLVGIGVGLALLYFGPLWPLVWSFLMITLLLFVGVYRCVYVLYLMISIVNREMISRKK
jgi:hypothetical protein